MNYIDLFSGIGGFALGAYWAGMKFTNHYFSEVDPYCVGLYQKRFPDAIPLGDITKIDPVQLPKDEYIITGGFPCQDISVAGKQEGIYGSRSSLWFEYRRIVSGVRPRFLIIENVAGLARSGLDIVLGNLAEIGYDAEWQDIRAEDVGAPHRRERIWIIAYPTIRRWGNTENPEIYKQRISDPLVYSSKNESAYPTSISRNSKTQSQRSQQSTLPPKRSIGNSRGWSTEPDVGRLVNGLSGRVDRLKGLGNSIVPQIAAVLFNKINNCGG